MLHIVDTLKNRLVACYQPTWKNRKCRLITVYNNCNIKNNINIATNSCKKGKGVEMNMKVRNMLSNRSGRPVSNQFVIQVGNTLYFQSYDSIVCVYEPTTKMVIFGRDWNYSVTTRKYLYQFLDENGVSLPNGKSGVDSIRKGIESGLFSYDETLF